MMIVLSFLLLIAVQIAYGGVTCRNEKGENVDWFYLYKLPMHHKPKITRSSDVTGLRYLYISSDQSALDWQLSSIYINETSSFPGQTLKPILEDANTVLVAYNDENPNGAVDFSDGHTKGVLAADTESGFWLIHSVPKYPNTKSDYDYPENGHHYGQSFLCISLSADQINSVGEQLIFNEPSVYDSRLPAKLANLYPNIEKVLSKQWKTVGPFLNEIELTTLNGVKFQSFAKGRKYMKELYEDWVAPMLKVNLFVETWRLGPGNLATNCTKKTHVLNVKEIEVKPFNIEFKTTSDHSKWGVADKKPWICVGDINRQEHQLIRGGGTVCQSNEKLATAYRNLVKNFEDCPRN